MQRLAILTIFTLTAAVWGAQQQSRVAAFQTEPQSQQPVTPENTQAPGADATSSDEANASRASQPAPAEPVADPAIVAKAEQLLREARDRLYDSKSVRATFTERANFGTRRFAAKGSYLSGPFPALRLEYRVQIGGSEGVLIEVCDGTLLRTSKEIRPIDAKSTAPTVSQWARKDIKQILLATNTPDVTDSAKLQAELSLGGIPTLLTSLERTMQFDVYREQQWQEQPVIVIEGGWRPEALNRVVQSLGAPMQQLAGLIPDRVRIYFDPQTLFPKRILYRKKIALTPPTFVPLMALEFSDIQLNQEELDPSEFRYVPPKGVDEIDETPLYLGMIQRANAIQQAAPNPPEGAESGQPAEQPPTASEQPPAAGAEPPATKP